MFTHDPPLTAGDLMSRDVKTVAVDLPVRDAARQFVRLGIRGAPVVDAAGRCVGMLSVSDVARWVAGADRNGGRRPRACNFQLVEREPGGRETVLCLLAEGACPLQRTQEAAGGQTIVCAEPHSVPTDWQLVDLESAPGLVRDVMTTEIVGVGPDTPLPELARVMLDRGVHRLIVQDAAGHILGVVAVNDLLQFLAHPELAGPASERLPEKAK